VVPPSLKEIRSVFRLVTDVQEQAPRDPRWRQMMAAGLSELIGADAGLASVSLEPLGYPPRPKTNCEFCGWSSAEWERWMRLEDECRAYLDPCMSAVSAPQSCPITASRRQLICDKAWYGAPYVNEVLHRVNVDDNLVSFYQVRVTGQWETLAFFRHVGRQPFSDMDVEVVRIFHEEIGRLWDRRAEATADLPPRMLQALQGLLAGQSEKEVAAEMGISTHTVHDYVKALHTKFRVRSRGELLAAADVRGLRLCWSVPGPRHLPQTCPGSSNGPSQHR
jgi:DNA-binding CsgD family transcriptional regulator